MLPKLTFILGGAASGKSLFAETLVLQATDAPIYIATAQIWDQETQERVDIHKGRRDERWQTKEAPLALGPALESLSASQFVLIDCATMWLSNHLMAQNDIAQAQAQLLNDLKNCPASIVIVSNEVGQGIVPQNALARHFREAQGRLNIELAHSADLVVQVTAGLPNALKGNMP